MASIPITVPLAIDVEAYEFGAFRLIPRRRRLLRDGAAVRIGSRAFDLLVLLASRAGTIVPHAELMSHAWPNRVVCDCNLRVQIAALQKVLGSAATGGRHIESVALRGYVFVSDVRALPASSDADRTLDGERRVLVLELPADGVAAQSRIAELIARLQALA